MSAKILQAVSDENPDLKKQIGCLTGIFQLFDRHHILSSKRIGGHKRLPSGHSGSNAINSGAEAIASSPQMTVAKLSGKHAIEHERISVESSTTSVSSTSFSSFSSLECNKAARSEQMLSTPSRISSKVQSSNYSNPKSNASHPDSPSSTPQSGTEFHGIQDVVKDSIYRQTQKLSVQTQRKQELINPLFKHNDSPRPLQLSKSLDGGAGGTRKPKMPLNIDESLRVLAKLKEGPWYSGEAREPARTSYEAKGGRYVPVPKESPRFSYDGRELSRASFDSRETSKSAARFRELPRLSLDSRQSSMKSSSLNSMSNTIAKDLQSLSNGEVGSYNHSSIVAKLMGLEPLSNSNQVDEKMGSANPSRIGSFSSERNSNVSRGNLRSREDHELNRGGSSAKDTLKENPSPRTRNSNPVIKPNAVSKFPIEAAPWKKESGPAAQKPLTRHSEAYSRQPTSPSVYSEIEKRLKDLDFKQSDKDLRALKQIVEAMVRRQVEKKEEEHHGPHGTVQKISTDQNQRKLDWNPTNRRTPLTKSNSSSLPSKGSRSPRALESPIVIMKSAKMIEKSSIPPSSIIPIASLTGIHKSRTGDSVDIRSLTINGRLGKDRASKLNLKGPGSQVPSSTEKITTSKNEETSSPRPQGRSAQSSSRDQSLLKEKPIMSSSTGSSSPRLQQRKVELERRSRPPVPSSDSDKPRRHPGRQPELGSPGGRRRPRPIPIDDHLSETGSETRRFSHGGDEISVISDSGASFLSQADTEVSSADRSAELIPSFKQKMSLTSPDGAGFMTVALEQPSPVSVLDDSFYRDDFMPSPVKHVSNAFKDAEEHNLDETFGEDFCHALRLDQSCGSAQSNITPDISKKKLANVQLLVQKLMRLNSGHDEVATDLIAFQREYTDPDHIYVSEILLASGLLLEGFKSDASPIQLHSSGYLINPDLFLVLEQRKTSSKAMADTSSENGLLEEPLLAKRHRKLMFDTVNEMLVWKLALAGHIEPRVQFKKLTKPVLSGQCLLRELCSELDRLCPKNLDSDVDVDENDDWLETILRDDVMHREESWTDFGREIPDIVLDVERMIFKDLIEEAINAEASSLRIKPDRRRRQLFIN